MVTATSLAPTVPTGVTAVIWEAVTTEKLVAAMPPIVTLVAPVKLVPVIVISVPPLTGPELGTTVVMVGALAVYVNAPIAVALPFGVVTTTFCAPAAPAGVTALI